MLVGAPSRAEGLQLVCLASTSLPTPLRHHGAMATPRFLLVDSEEPMCYHLVSRCVRQAKLCGYHGGRSYAHRRRWIEKRIRQLGAAFGVDVLAYAVMSNHFHIVVYYDPKACLRWSDAQVVERWLRASAIPESRRQSTREELLKDPERLQRCRERLGSLSAFMQQLKQPIAVRINQEDKVKGHLFAQRFYSGALLDERAVLAAMQYVDLNPVRARMADSLQSASHTSIARRLEALANTPERLEQYLAPIACGATSPDDTPRHPAIPRLTLREYVALLEQTMAFSSSSSSPSEQPAKAAIWQRAAALLRKQQRAYGHAAILARWLERRKFRPLETSFSAP